MVKEFLNSKFATVVLAASLILIMTMAAKILVQKRMVDGEVAKLEKQMEKIKSDNEQLGSLIQYLNTPEYKERQAREKLNLAREGEHVVVLPQGEVAATSHEQTDTRPSNYKLWFNYFFHVN